MSDIISIPLNKLIRSVRNVRKSGGESIDDLASSILAHGLIHNLTVVEQLADRRMTLPERFARPNGRTKAGPIVERLYF
jgi:hypothetical protein